VEMKTSTTGEKERKVTRSGSGLLSILGVQSVVLEEDTACILGASLDDLIRVIFFSRLFPDEDMGYFMLGYSSVCTTRELSSSFLNAQKWCLKSPTDTQKMLRKKAKDSLFRFIKSCQVFAHNSNFILKLMEFWEIAKLGNHQELNDLKLKVMQVRQKQPPLDDLPYSAELRIFSFLVSKYSTQEIAEAMTFIQMRHLAKVQPCEFLNNAFSRKSTGPNLYLLTQYFNSVSYWVATGVLCSSESPLKMTQLFIRLAAKFYKMNNFDLLLAVLSGLNNVSVLRLKTLIWKKMPSKYRELFRNLEATMSATNGFLNYKKSLALVQPPCIPYIGLYLKEITYICDGNHKVFNGVINEDAEEESEMGKSSKGGWSREEEKEEETTIFNIERILMLGRRISEFYGYIKVKYDISPPNELVRVMTDPPHVEDEKLYHKSLKLQKAAKGMKEDGNYLTWQSKDLIDWLVKKGMDEGVASRIASAGMELIESLDHAALKKLGFGQLKDRKDILRTVRELPSYQRENSELPNCFATDYHQWNCEQVCEWLLHLGYEKEIVKLIKKGEINGHTLPVLDKNMLVSVGVKKLSVRSMLLKDIKQLITMAGTSEYDESPLLTSTSTTVPQQPVTRVRSNTVSPGLKALSLSGSFPSTSSKSSCSDSNKSDNRIRRLRRNLSTTSREKIRRQSFQEDYASEADLSNIGSVFSDIPSENPFASFAPVGFDPSNLALSEGSTDQKKPNGKEKEKEEEEDEEREEKGKEENPLCDFRFHQGPDEPIIDMKLPRRMTVFQLRLRIKRRFHFVNQVYYKTSDGRIEVMTGETRLSTMIAAAGGGPVDLILGSK